MVTAAQLGFQRCLYCSASLMTEHDKQGCVEMRFCVPKAALNFGRNHVSGNAHDEQLSKSGIKDLASGCNGIRRIKIVAQGC